MKARIREADGQAQQGQFNRRESDREGLLLKTVTLYPEVIMKNQQSVNPLVLTGEIKQKFITVRGQLTLLDRDVAALYGVETRVINQAVKNNPEKFPLGYVVELTSDELAHLRSKLLTANVSPKSRALPKVFTERGLYMLATILKGEQAVRTTLAIIETYAQVRAMVRDMEALQTLKDGSVEQATKLSQAGHKLASLIGDNLSTDSTKTTIELNLAVLKITHEVIRAKTSDSDTASGR